MMWYNESMFLQEQYTRRNAVTQQGGPYKMLKLSKAEGAIILLAAAFLAFVTGWTLRGTGQSGPVRVETQRSLGDVKLTLAVPTPEPETEKVDVNTATLEELMTLPGIGEKRAQDIIAEREANGPFRFPEDLTRVSGIGDQTVAGLLDYITVEGVAP